MSTNNKKKIKETINARKLGISTFYKDIKYGISIFKKVAETEKCFESFGLTSDILKTINLENSESYSLGFGEDEDISLTEMLKDSINITSESLQNSIKKIICNMETRKLLDFTVFTIPDEPFKMPYLMYSNKQSLLLGIGLLEINHIEDTVKYNTFIFYNYLNPLTAKSNKLFDLNVINKHIDHDLYDHSIYSDMNIEDYLGEELFVMNITEKELFLSNFVNSEYYTNIHDRTFINILATNSQLLSKVVFVKKGLFFDNLISYSQFSVSDKDSLCAFKIRCNERSDDTMDKLPRMDALEYLLEHYDKIFIQIPVPSSIVEAMDEKLYKNQKELNSYAN